MASASCLREKREKNDTIFLNIAKVTGDLLIASKVVDMEQFATFIAERFEIRKTFIDNELIFNWCRIRKDSTIAIMLDTIEFIAKVHTVLLSPAQKAMARLVKWSTWSNI